jgi:hypothetical protein
MVDNTKVVKYINPKLIAALAAPFNYFTLCIAAFGASLPLFGLLFLLPAQSPDIQASQTFTSTAPGAAVFNPATRGAASWRLTFNPTGFTAATVQVESAEDCGGTACATWTAINSANVTNGTNPVLWTASPVVSTTIAFKFNHPWLRVNVTSTTGTGSIKTLLLGYRGTKPI